jgi:3-hydroxyacyl-CoA dehydrogenase/enoyl-CoA hydratase/3-hydroxybutyryl-CoA epimerase/3-hydroxyacyl-CoA dehydrogenase/enoyl-CoA hydratase/3-hydroxybutyryl-CoA epimerase/enoyl-CoA isomerase
MPASLKLDIVDGLAVITFDKPDSKANTLGMAIVAEFEQLLASLKDRTDLGGLILRSGKPGMFIAGADLKELGAADPKNQAMIRGLIQRGLGIPAAIETLPFPTVALIDGPCLGGGLEVALGFDVRLAGTSPKVEIGLPEVKIGLIPGWGGTQRLTRIIGPSQAAEMICSGEPVRAKRALELGIVFDVVATEKLESEARRILKDLAASGAWKDQREKRRQPVGLSEEQMQFTFAVARAMVLDKTKGKLPAPMAALDAIEKGCNRPLDEGLKFETEAMVPLVGSPISRSLIAVFFMNQKIAKDTGVADATIQPMAVKRVGVLGAGIMGAGIASAHVRKGVPAVVLDSNPQALEKGIAGIAAGFKGLVEKGRMKPDDLVAALARLGTAGSLSNLSECDVVIEAIVENEQAKVAMYKQLEPLLRPDAILASNTSTISITRMAQSVSKPERFAGMHFFNPVERMPLVEVIRGEKTSDATIVSLVAMARRIGKSPIVVKDGPGFLVNRILFPYLNEALILLEEGAEPRAIDKAALEFGMPMGPITLYDVVGLDTSLFAGAVLQAAYPDRAVGSKLLAEMVKSGRLGQKSGAGFFAYAKGPKGTDDPAFAAILAKHRTQQKTFTDEELTQRLFLPMLTEAVRALQEGIVRDPVDLDMALIMGIGFPAWRGGLMRWADATGLAKIVEMLKRYQSLGARYAVPEMLAKKAAEGGRFHQM